MLEVLERVAIELMPLAGLLAGAGLGILIADACRKRKPR